MGRDQDGSYMAQVTDNLKLDYGTTQSLQAYQIIIQKSLESWSMFSVIKQIYVHGPGVAVPMYTTITAA
jgi:hypothetical protein